jgi:hypothetical protein
MHPTVLTAALAIGLGISSSAPAQIDDVTFHSELRQFIVKGEDRRVVDITVTLTADSLVLSQAAATTAVPYSSISSMTYDRRSRVRVIAPSFGKRQEHVLTVQYKADGIGRFVEIEMGKRVAPNLIATLEARSGRRIEKIVAS